MNSPLTYPVGEQDFANIRNDKRVYVDKTALIFRLVTEGKYYFLSRPRRFGKSLLLTTLKYYFEGRRELFEGLAIDQLESQWNRHPVFLFDMSRDKIMDEVGLKNMLNQILAEYEKQYGITPLPDDTPSSRLINLILTSHEQTGLPAVVLIDEYDAPMLDVSGDNERLTAMRNIMRGFYSPLKAMAAHLRFVLLTGITKFSQLSIFSELNNLKNISMVPAYDSICGITHEELITQLRPGIEQLAQQQGITADTAVQLLKQYYDGYHFSRGLTDIYNPFSLIYALSVGEVGAFWFESGTPSWLLEQMHHFDTDLVDLERVEVTTARFDTPSEKINDIVPVLYQSGYMTIKDYDREAESYILGIPNKEVRMGLGEAATYYSNPNALRNRDYLRIAYFKLQRHQCKVDEFMDKLDCFLRAIPYDISNDNEKHFQAIIYATIAGFGADISAEERTSNGRADIVVKMKQDIYIIELKYGKTAVQAMDQLLDKDYAAKFSEDGRPIFLLAINIGPATRGVDSWLCQQAHHR